MAMKTLINLFIIGIALLFSSCQKDETTIYGEAEWYTPWLFHSYTPIKMERTLDLEFNDDAKRWLESNPLCFQLFEINEEGNIQSANNVKLYLNGELCKNNIFSIDTKKQSIKMAIEFLDDADEGIHSFILKDITTGNNKLDVITYEGFGKDDIIHVQKIVIMNPLKKNVILTSIVILILAILWYFISRFIIWRSVSFSKVYITYPNQEHHTIRMSGKYQLVCSNNKHAKDSLLNVLFKGKKQYEYNEFWSHPIIIERGRNAKSIRISKLGDFTLNGDKIRKQPFEIIDSEGNIVIIETT